jgi:hypothetical protein
MTPKKPEPANKAKDRGFVALAVVGGLAIAALINVMPSTEPASAKGQPPEIRYVQQPDIIDQPAQEILDAQFNAILVQSGTTLPYTGYGLPGIYLTVKSTSIPFQWTFAGWANRTVDDLVCKGRTVYFSPYDWTSQAGSADGATFATVPTTVPARLLPGGDQCQTQGTGQWNFTVCIEEGGMPQRIYDDEDGFRHVDNFDRCIHGTAAV